LRFPDVHEDKKVELATITDEHDKMFFMLENMKMKMREYPPILKKYQFDSKHMNDSCLCIMSFIRSSVLKAYFDMIERKAKIMFADFSWVQPPKEFYTALRSKDEGMLAIVFLCSFINLLFFLHKTWKFFSGQF
jgi:hypothetical protein